MFEDRSVNILVCNYEYPPLGGGGGVTTKRLAEELARKHAVTVLTSGYKGAPRHESLNGVEIWRVPVLRGHRTHTASVLSMVLYWPLSVLRGARLAKEKFGVIHAHFAIPTGPGSLMLARMLGIPHVLSIHGGDLFDPSKRLSPHRTWGLRYAVQSVINGSDRVLAQSSDTRQNAYTYYRVTRPIEIIPHAIKRPAFLRKGRKELGFDTEDILLIAIGRLVPRKGMDLLIRAVAELRDHHVKLVVVGDGPEKTRLAKEIRSRGLEQRVLLKGMVSEDEKFQLLDIANVYASASFHEGFGLIFIEAMACGLPIIACDKGGHLDFLADGHTGYLVRTGDLDALRERLALLCARPEIRKAMAATNMKLAEQFYMEQCAARHETVFKEVTATEGCRSRLAQNRAP